VEPTAPSEDQMPMIQPIDEPVDADPAAETGVQEMPAEPSQATAQQVATIGGTGGDGVRCRVAPSADAEVIATLTEGITVSVLGASENGWTPVECQPGATGYVSSEFVKFAEDSDSGTGSEVSGSGELAAPTPEGGDPLAVATDIPEAELVPSEPTGQRNRGKRSSTLPTEVAVAVEMPLSIVSAEDSEQSGIAMLAIDSDPATVWQVTPVRSPSRVELTLDLGQRQPVDRISIGMSRLDLLPHAEIWLSEDGWTWWNVAAFDPAMDTVPTGDDGYQVPLGYWTQYVKLVVPDTDQQGLVEIGGIGTIAVWAGAGETTARSLDQLGSPVTPEPFPTEIPVATSEPETTDPTQAADQPLPTSEVVPPPSDELPADEPDTGDDGPVIIGPAG
ncbi:MAG TPA: SH3 domain-containing protein, partial [Thermomicrobiales bacterium]|nr:SH3 domain-containing protein [Thermomicrobiales bacterium]